MSASREAIETGAESFRLVASVPINGASYVPVENLIALRFSAPLRVDTVTAAAVFLQKDTSLVTTTAVAAEGGMLVFVLPQAPLLPNTNYVLTLRGLEGILGQVLSPTSVQFTTAPSGAAGSAATDTQGLDVAPLTSTVQETAAESATLDGDEEWIPDASNSRGNWRSGRAPALAAKLPPLRATSGVTALTGQVLLLNGKPLAGVTLKIDRHTAQTDSNGQFLLTGLSPGLHEMLMDGQAANRGGKVYGVFEIGVDIEAGKTNILPYTLWMPRIDTAHAITIPSPTTREAVITTPLIPGLELHIPPGMVIRDHEGNAVTEISITPIPVDQPPHPLPDVEVPVYFTVQPGGAYLVGSSQGSGGWLVYPNYVGQQPGARSDFWRYDPEFPRGWSVYGQGTVTPDGSQIVPDPGVRLYEFTGAMINDGTNSPPENGPTCGGQAGDPCDLGTGLFLLEETDLTLPDVLPLQLSRTYRTRDTNSRPFGIGMTHLYAMFLWSARQYVEADLILPDGARVHYVRISPGTGFTDAIFEHTATPSRFYKSRIAWNGNGWDLKLKNGMVYVFGENAPLQAIRDRYGNTISLTRTNGQRGNITQVTSSNGRWIKFVYDSGNRITQATDNGGRTVAYTYDASGRLVKVTGPQDRVIEYTYDTAHRMKTHKARGKLVVTNTYDPTSGRILQQDFPDTGTYKFAYLLDATGKEILQATVTNPRGVVRQVKINTDGYMTEDTRALGKPEAQTTRYVRRPGSNLIDEEIDSLTRRTKYTYDAFGNRRSMTRLFGTPQAVTTQWEYTSVFQQVSKIIDPLLHPTTFSYDARGNLIAITDALSHQTKLNYNGAGQPTAIAQHLDATNALVTRLTYDLGDLVSVSDHLQNTTTLFTDAIGRVVSTTNPLGQRTRYSYDGLNRIRTLTDPLGKITSFDYYPNGDLQKVRDARPGTSQGVTEYTYNAKNRVATRKDPLLKTETFAYDTMDNRTQVIDRKGQITRISYDALDRPKTVTYQDGSTITYTYDNGDRLLQIADSLNGTISRTYDGLDRLISETTAQGKVTYAYDKAGRRTSMAVAGQPAVLYTYDNADHLTRITQGTAVATLAYDNVNRRRTGLALPNGVLITYSYDAASRLTGITYRKGAATLGNLTYAYDQAGQRRVTGGTFARTGIPQPVTTATCNAANQQKTFGNKSMTYDANGNLLMLTDPSGATTYGWNARNQLVTIRGPGVSANFYYDALGRRRLKLVNGVARSFLYDGLDIVQELSGTTPVANLLMGVGIDEVLTRTDAAGARAFLADGLGSTVALTNSTGVVATQYTYEPFGKTTATGAAPTNAFKYTGREDDGTGLYYYRSRYYHPQLQRFISQDPIGFDGGDVNLYGYVGNDPINFIDPYGLFTCIDPAVCDFSTRTEEALECFDRCTGRDTKITSGRDSHLPDDPHSRGEACDIGRNSNPDLSRSDAEKCFDECFPSSSYAQEESNGARPGTHFHFQYTSGIGGAHGFSDGVKPHGRRRKK